MLCKIQQTIIYFGIKSVLYIGSVSKRLRKRPFNKPNERLTIIRADERRLLKII